MAESPENLDPDYADRMLTDIRDLRRRVIEAWQSRGIGLTRDERHKLRNEIHETCLLLTELTRSD